MNIKVKYKPYAGCQIRTIGGTVLDYTSIKDNFFTLNGRVGKVIHLGTITIREHGFNAEMDKLGFVFQDDLSVKRLEIDEEILLEDASI